VHDPELFQAFDTQLQPGIEFRLVESTHKVQVVGELHYVHGYTQAIIINEFM